MTNMFIDQNIIYSLVALIAILGFLLFMVLIIIFFNSTLKTMFLANLKKVPIIQIHTSLKQTKLFAAKKGGKHGNANVYDIKEFGIKFTPLPGMVEHIGSSRHINYYSKCGYALSAKAVAAFRDIENLLKAKGIEPSETILDILLVMSDEEIEELYNVELNTLDNGVISLTSNEVLEIRDELKEAYIKDGQFVWETARNFVFLLQTETSRSLDEYIAIVREQALDDARLGGIDKESMRSVITIITLLMGGIIAYKMLVG